MKTASFFQVSVWGFQFLLKVEQQFAYKMRFDKKAGKILPLNHSYASPFLELTPFVLVSPELSAHVRGCLEGLLDAWAA